MLFLGLGGIIRPHISDSRGVLLNPFANAIGVYDTFPAGLQIKYLLVHKAKVNRLGSLI